MKLKLAGKGKKEVGWVGGEDIVWTIVRSLVFRMVMDGEHKESRRDGVVLYAAVVHLSA